MQIRCLYDKLARVDELKPHPKNRNNHPEAQIERLAKLLRYQGVRAPIVVSKLSGYIVKGHGTLEAIRLNGWQQAPVVEQEFDDQDQEYAFLQSDNAIALWADLDLSSIQADLGELGDAFDFEMLGLEDFKAEEVDLPEIDTEATKDLQSMTFILSNAQADSVRRAMAAAEKLGVYPDELNENRNAAQLATVAEIFLSHHEASKS